MRIHQGGQPFSFCPGKATWDHEAMRTFSLLVVAAETGAMLGGGGIVDQPSWWVETLAWFLPVYDMAKFASRVRSVMGNGKKSGKTAGEHGAALAPGQS